MFNAPYTIMDTSKTPEESYVWMGLTSVDSFPSPKIHFTESEVPTDSFVKDTESGPTPSKGVALKSAKTAVGSSALIYSFRARVSLP